MHGGDDSERRKGALTINKGVRSLLTCLNDVKIILGCLHGVSMRFIDKGIVITLCRSVNDCAITVRA